MKVLVAAASKHGATSEIAAAIAAALADSQIDAGVLAPDQVGTVEAYHAVVLGSAIYMGRWLEPANRFVDRNAAASPPVLWLFSSAPVGDPPKPEEDPADMAVIIERTGAREHRVFAGKLLKSGLGLAEKAIAAALRAPEGDYRDWDEVREWALGIARTLEAERAMPA